MDFYIDQKRFFIRQSEYDMRCFEGSTDEAGKNDYRLAKNRVSRYKRELKELEVVRALSNGRRKLGALTHREEVAIEETINWFRENN